jgi:hypothetical protein
VQSKIEPIKSGNIFMAAVTKGRDQLSVYAGADAAGLADRSQGSLLTHKASGSRKLQRATVSRNQK